MAEREVAGSCSPEQLERFRATFLYAGRGFLVDEVTRLDPEFRFFQGDVLVYAGDQTAMFLKGLEEPA